MKNGTFVISLDFELMWGIRDLEHTSKGDNIIATRDVVPRLLDLFVKYDIHATWATVGFLFFESRAEMLSFLPTHQPNYLNERLSPYKHILKEVGEDESTDPLHFAPSLIRQIIATPHQELATHTFSHYYCLEDGQTLKDFEADLRVATRLGEKYDRKIQSIVFPRNQYSNSYLEVCAANGLLTFRGNESIWFRNPSKRKDHRSWVRRLFRLMDAYINISGTNAYILPSLSDLPVNIPSSRYLRPYSKRLNFLEPLRLNRILSSLRKSAQNGHIFHLWWHPEDFSTHIEDNMNILEKILVEYKNLHEQFGMKSLSMAEVADTILSGKEH